MAFSNDGTRIALPKTTVAPGVGQQIRNDLQVLDARTGEIAVFNPPQKGSSLTSTPSAVGISPAGDRAALVLTPVSMGLQGVRIPGSEIYIWDIATAKLLTSFSLDKTLVGSFQFSPNGKIAALSTASLNSATIVGGVDIYDTTTGRLLGKLDGAELQQSQNPILFSPDGNRLAGVTGKADRTVTIWDARTGAKLVSLPEASNTIKSIAFSPDGTRLVSVSSDGDVQLWDSASGRALITLRESSGPYAVREVTVDALGAQLAARLPTSEAKAFSVSFSPDGRKITLTTVGPDPKGRSVRIVTWDGSPRRK